MRETFFLTLVPRLYVRILLCASSYSPLMVLIGLRSWSQSRFTAQVFLGLAIVSVMLLWAFFAAHRRRQPVSVAITAVQQRDGDVMGYVITYLVPFANTTFRDSNGAFDVPSLLSVIVLFLVIVIVYINANLIFINPILALVRYRIYEVELAATGEKKALLTRRAPVPTAKPLQAVSLGPYVLWEPEQ